MPLRLFKELYGRAQPETQAAAPPASTVVRPIAPKSKSPPEPPPLRPLLLVARQQARAAENEARRGLGAGQASAPQHAPRPPPPQLYTQAPWGAQRALRPQPQPQPQVLAPPPEPLSPRSVRYNVNDRIERARAVRSRAQSIPKEPAARNLPIPSELPYLTEEGLKEVMRDLRAQGSELPNLVRQAERGQPLMVPPRRNSSLKAAGAKPRAP